MQSDEVLVGVDCVRVFVGLINHSPSINSSLLLYSVLVTFFFFLINGWNWTNNLDLLISTIYHSNGHIMRTISETKSMVSVINFLQFLTLMTTWYGKSMEWFTLISLFHWGPNWFGPINLSPMEFRWKRTRCEFNSYYWEWNNGSVPVVFKFYVT